MNRMKKEIQALQEKGFCISKDLRTLKRAMLYVSKPYPMTGVIHFGTQLDRRYWIEEAQQQGRVVQLVGERAFIY